MGGIGGGSLEHPRQWLGAQWADWEPSEEAQEPSWGTAKGGLWPHWRLEAIEPLGAAAREHQLAARLGEAPRTGLADAAGRPGDQHHVARDVRLSVEHVGPPERVACSRRLQVWEREVAKERFRGVALRPP